MATSSSPTIPIGTVMMWAGSIDSGTILKLIFDGWVVCDGSSYETDKEQVKDLFPVIGEAYGGGAGTFCVPSYKGVFLRGVTGTTDRDPNADTRTPPRPDQSNSGNSGNAVGSMQSYDIRSHTHSYNYYSDYHKSTHTAGNHCLSGSTTGKMNGVGGSESRPVNQYVNFIIKANSLGDVVPVGAIAAFAGPHTSEALANAGWLVCDGAKTKISEYPNLKTVLANAYGAEQGYYYLPDYRGRFLRGVQGQAIPGTRRADPGSRNRTAPQPGLPIPGNSGNQVGSVQTSQYQQHSHTYTFNNDFWSTAGTLIGPDMQANNANSAESGSTGGSETRPININTNYVIKCQ